MPVSLDVQPVNRYLESIHLIIARTKSHRVEEHWTSCPLNRCFILLLLALLYCTVVYKCTTHAVHTIDSKYSSLALTVGSPPALTVRNVVNVSRLAI